MSTCVPTPVSTAFSTVTVDTITTTYSFSTSAVPPIITTRVDPYCENEAVLLDSTVCLKTGTKAGTETLQRTFPSLVTSTLLSSHVSRVIFSFFCSTSEELTLSRFSIISIQSS